jgi:hypothetical protein
VIETARTGSADKVGAVGSEKDRGKERAYQFAANDDSDRSKMMYRMMAYEPELHGAQYGMRSDGFSSLFMPQVSPSRIGVADGNVPLSQR